GGDRVDFVTVVDQAIALLRQRGRVTYRTLQRQFHLDEAALDDLKDELIYGQRLAVDEEGRVLVWSGEAATTAPAAASVGTLAPAARGGGASPGRAGRPRGRTNECPREPRPSLPHQRRPGVCYPDARPGAGLLSCCWHPERVAMDRSRPGLCLCAPGAPR